MRGEAHVSAAPQQLTVVTSHTRQSPMRRRAIAAPDNFTPRTTFRPRATARRGSPRLRRSILLMLRWLQRHHHTLISGSCDTSRHGTRYFYRARAAIIPRFA